MVSRAWWVVSVPATRAVAVCGGRRPLGYAQPGVDGHTGSPVVSRAAERCTMPATLGADRRTDKKIKLLLGSSTPYYPNKSIFIILYA